MNTSHTPTYPANEGNWLSRNKWKHIRTTLVVSSFALIAVVVVLAMMFIKVINHSPAPANVELTMYIRLASAFVIVLYSIGLCCAYGIGKGLK